MTPIHFGSRDRFLFGLYDPPAAGGRDLGIVLCNAFGQEGMRAHRAFRQLAQLLARARAHVFRFDYYGTGDSAGESWAGNTKEWTDNLHAASDELRDMAGVTKLAWVGLRFGAVIALRASESRKDLDTLVLWDPVVDGRAYVDELRRLHVDFLKNDMGPCFRPQASGRFEEVAGFPLNDELRSEMENFRISHVKETAARRVTAVLTGDEKGRSALVQELSRLRPGATVDAVATPVNWNSEEAMTTALVPLEVLEAIVARIP